MLRLAGYDNVVGGAEKKNMAEKLLMVLVNTNPDNGPGLSVPLLQATVAAAMEYETEVIFTGLAGKLAERGVTEKLFLQGPGSRSIYSVIQDAHAAGVKFKVCTPTFEKYGNDLIPEISETVGGTYIISEAMDDDTVTFTY